jgi:hypothetical protein
VDGVSPQIFQFLTHFVQHNPDVSMKTLAFLQIRSKRGLVISSPKLQVLVNQQEIPNQSGKHTVTGRKTTCDFFAIFSFGTRAQKSLESLKLFFLDQTRYENFSKKDDFMRPNASPEINQTRRVVIFGR